MEAGAHDDLMACCVPLNLAGCNRHVDHEHLAHTTRKPHDRKEHSEIKLWRRRLDCHSLAFVYKVGHGSRRDASSLSRKRGFGNETKARACCDQTISNFGFSFNLVPPKVTSGTSAKARATRRDWA